MEEFEWESSLKPSDWVSAALAYRKVTGEGKKFQIYVWVFVGFALGTIVLPGILFLGLILAICLPTRTCSPIDLWRFAQLLVFIVMACALSLMVAYTSIFYRLRMELYYRRMFALNKDLTLPARIKVRREGVTVYEHTHETTFYWKSFQRFIETKTALILSPQKNRVLIFPKRDLKSLEQETELRNFIEALTNINATKMN